MFENDQKVSFSSFGKIQFFGHKSYFKVKYDATRNVVKCDFFKIFIHHTSSILMSLLKGIWCESKKAKIQIKKGFIFFRYFPLKIVQNCPFSNVLSKIRFWIFGQKIRLLHNVWKLLKMSHLDFSILTFSTNFCHIKIDLSGNTVWPQCWMWLFLWFSNTVISGVWVENGWVP